MHWIACTFIINKKVPTANRTRVNIHPVNFFLPSSLIIMQNLAAVSHIACVHAGGPKNLGDCRTHPLKRGVVHPLETRYSPRVLSCQICQRNAVSESWYWQPYLQKIHDVSSSGLKSCMPFLVMIKSSLSTRALCRCACCLSLHDKQRSRLSQLWMFHIQFVSTVQVRPDSHQP